MFDHHFLGGLAHDQIALLFMAAAAKAPRRSAVRMSTRVAGISAAILAIATIVMACYIAHMELTGLRAAGQVIAIRVDAAGLDREPTYYPVIEFAAASGALLRFEDFGGGSPRYRVGDPVAVLYRGDEASLFAIVDRDRSSNLLLPLLPLCGALWFGWPFVRRIRLRLLAMASGRTSSLAMPGAMRSRRRMMNV